MLPTYKAILKGNRVEWCGDVDRNIVGNHPVAVHITILDDPVAPASVESRGKLMVTALERLAEIHALADVVDPAAWEREIRKDRLLPGRQERC
jgi:hypothetical protein